MSDLYRPQGLSSAVSYQDPKAAFKRAVELLVRGPLRAGELAQALDHQLSAFKAHVERRGGVEIARIGRHRLATREGDARAGVSRVHRGDRRVVAC